MRMFPGDFQSLEECLPHLTKLEELNFNLNRWANLNDHFLILFTGKIANLQNLKMLTLNYSEYFSFLYSVKEE